MRLVVAGTDTGVGKTAFAAALAGALNAYYWKPVQAGSLDCPDRAAAARLSGLPQERLIEERYLLSAACSPHRSAQLDGIVIDDGSLVPPDASPLVVETAGGVLVPLTRHLLFADLIKRWGFPVILVARTSLGTINHSLLSLEALRSRSVPVKGVAFVGEPDHESEEIICAIGRVKRLGRLPPLKPLDRWSLASAFRQQFNLPDFL